MKKEMKSVSQKLKNIANAAKAGLKKITPKGRVKKEKASDQLREIASKALRAKIKTARLHSAQQQISGTKFYTSTPTSDRVAEERSPAIATELPEKYYEDKIILQVRDPWWVHTYWEVRDSTIHDIMRRYENKFSGARAILRVYDISYIIFNGDNAHRSFDIDINFEIKNWYIDVAEPGRSWCIDIGFLLKDGTFVRIARSNAVTTPNDGPSSITDEEWMIPDDVFARLYGMGFGFGQNSPTGKGWQTHLRGAISSPGLFSLSSPIKPRQKKKDFWLIVNTELIVYGATESDAKVTVAGQPIKLNPDGTFSLRFALPDGRKEIPVHAVSAHDAGERTITPIVLKETH